VTHNRKTCHRYNTPGDAHALTFSCYRRQSFLNADRTRQWLVHAIREAMVKHRYHLWAYVVMPEHVHLLVWPTEHEYDISTFLSSVKLPVTRKALAFVRTEAPQFLANMRDRQPNGDEHYRFWQRGGGYDRNLTEPTTIWSEMDYIHANPVRRGLCERAVDWFWSSAADYLGVRQGPLVLDTSSLPRTPIG